MVNVDGWLEAVVSNHVGCDESMAIKMFLAVDFRNEYDAWVRMPAFFLPFHVHLIFIAPSDFLLLSSQNICHICHI
jgi:hypothetical protein